LELRNVAVTSNERPLIIAESLASHQILLLKQLITLPILTTLICEKSRAICVPHDTFPSHRKILQGVAAGIREGKQGFHSSSLQHWPTQHRANRDLLPPGIRLGNNREGMIAERIG